MSAHLLDYPLPFMDSSGNPIVGATITFFEPGGSSTPKSVWSDSTLSTSAGTSVTTDASGLPEKSGTSIEVYGDGDYYVVFTPPSGPVRDYEWLEENTTATAATEWTVSGLTPTFLTATTFSVPGDQTDTLHVGRALKIELAATTIYRDIEASVFTSVTTITVATGLTDPITSFDYGFLSAVNQSFPANISADLTGNVTGNVTGDLTGDVVCDTITTGTTDGDIAITRNGTGDLTVDSAPIFGLVMLNNPISLVNNTATSSTTQTAFDLTPHTTGVAVKAVLNIGWIAQADTTSFDSKIRVGEGGVTLSDIHMAGRTWVEGSGLIAGSNQITVNLFAGEIFDYEIVIAGTAPTQHNVTIHLAGYYI